MNSRIRFFLRLLAVIALVAVFLLLDAREWLDSVITWVAGLGPWGPVAFIAVYVVATVLMIPGAPLGLAAGALFGVLAGTALVSFGSTIGAALAFLIARHLARDAVAARLAQHASFASLDCALEREGWKIVALARLSPVFPYSLLNFAFGLTSVRFLHYVTVSWVSMLPGTLLYVYLGSLARAGTERGAKTPAEWILHGAGLAATVLVTVLITRISRRAIREAGLTDKTAETHTASC